MIFVNILLYSNCYTHATQRYIKSKLSDINYIEHTEYITGFRTLEL